MLSGHIYDGFLTGIMKLWSHLRLPCVSSHTHKLLAQRPATMDRAHTHLYPSRGPDPSRSLLLFGPVPRGPGTPRLNALKTFPSDQLLECVCVSEFTLKLSTTQHSHFVLGLVCPIVCIVVSEWPQSSQSRPVKDYDTQFSWLPLVPLV